MNFLSMLSVILLSMLMILLLILSVIDDTTLDSKCDQTSDLWKELELDSEP